MGIRVFPDLLKGRSIHVPVYYGWRIVAAVWLTFLVSFGAIYYAYGIFFVKWETEFGWSRALLGGVQTAINLIVALLGPLFGVLSDKIGTRPLVVAGAVLVGLGIVLVSRINSPWQLYLAFLVAGIGLSASGHIVLIALVSRWFQERRGIALGFAETGMGMGGVVIVPVTGLAVAAFGWRWSIAGLGMLVWLVVVPLALLVMRTAPKPSEVMHRVTPEQARRRSQGLALGQALRTWQIWSIAAALSFAGLASSAAFSHLMPFLTDVGVSTRDAATMFSLTSACLLLGKIFFGYMSDRASPKTALLTSIVVGMIATTMQLALLVWGHPMYGVLMAVTTVGFVCGAFTVIMPTLIGATFGARYLASIMGVVFLFAMSGMALGPFVAGRMFDTNGSYKSFFILSLSAYACAGMVATALKPVRQDLRENHRLH
jgi:MFS family permease